MANHASAEKRNRQRITRTERNRSAKSFLKKTLKTAREALAAGAANAAALVKVAQVELDCAASKSVIPDGRASRLKARLALQLARAGK